MARAHRLYTILIWIGLLAVAWSLPAIDLVSRLQFDRDADIARYYQPGKPAGPASGLILQQSQSERPAPSRNVRG